MFLFTSIMFYFFWDNIFMNLINWAGTDMMNTGLTNSVNTLKSFAWVSFILVYLLSSPIYLLFCLISGVRNDVNTEPIEILKGIGIWAVSIPLMIILLGIMYNLIGGLGEATNNIMDTASLTFADNISWIITLLVMIVINVFPLFFIMKGYGINNVTKMLEGEGNV